VAWKDFMCSISFPLFKSSQAQHELTYLIWCHPCSRWLGTFQHSAFVSDNTLSPEVNFSVGYIFLLNYAYKNVLVLTDFSKVQLLDWKKAMLPGAFREGCWGTAARRIG